LARGGELRFRPEPGEHIVGASQFAHRTVAIA
jgi:hypothetical protein